MLLKLPLLLPLTLPKTPPAKLLMLLKTLAPKPPTQPKTLLAKLLTLPKTLLPRPLMLLKTPPKTLRSNLIDLFCSLGYKIMSMLQIKRPANLLAFLFHPEQGNPNRQPIRLNVH
jgi:hypothetical protein